MTRNTKVILTVLAIALALILPPLVFLLFVPQLSHSVMRANEASAVAQLRKLNAAEVQYALTYPDRGFACTLSAMGSVSSGNPGPDSAQLIDAALVSGTKSGYTFLISNCSMLAEGGKKAHTSYRITAVPTAPGHSGARGFCTDDSDLIHFDPNGGANCSELLP